MALTAWLAGIDIGLNSVGFSAVEIDQDGMPVRLLNAQSVFHDAGIGRDGAKTATTRLALSGAARRHRRLLAQRRKRLARLDRWIVAQGWPLVDPAEHQDPFWPWTVRAALATRYVENEVERGAMLSAALRHMARHRGWRSPWSPVESLMTPLEPSAYFQEMRARFEAETGSTAPEDATPALLIAARGLTPVHRIRTRAARNGDQRPGILGSKLHQSDYASALRRMGQVQRMPDDLVNQMITHVFAAKSPKGSGSKRVGVDPLAPHQRRASKATLEFQRYRIVTLLTHLRIREPAVLEERPLTAAELTKVTDLLWSASPKDEPTWSDVAEELGLEREQLRGTMSVTEDGERTTSLPPINVTGRVIRTLSVKPVAAWWHTASDAEQCSLVDRLVGDADTVDGSAAESSVNDLYEHLDEAQLAAMAEIKGLPAGRAPYSRETLTRIADRILATGENVRDARKNEFGLADDWAPPVDPIGHPVGNPAVDRVTKLVARWLRAMTDEYGVPERVTVEHARQGFVSASTAREMDRTTQARLREREKLKADMVSAGQAITADSIRRADIYRYRAYIRQDGRCLYCGTPIDVQAFEIDHIVPRKAHGPSSSRRANLAAVCVRCHRSKGNVPFAVWAQACGIDGVTVEAAQDRVRHFPRERPDSAQSHRRFTRETIARLSRKSEDDEIDARRMESVNWMADELRRRITHHFGRLGSDTTVAVYRGGLTAEARKASGVEGQNRLLGGMGTSNRLDRRHHAMDALVVSVMTHSVATVLAERTALREEEQLVRADETWSQYRGRDDDHRDQFDRWQTQTVRAIELFNDALTEDRVVVRQNLRLRIGDGKAHDDKIRTLLRRRVGDSIPMELIDRAATPALWCALTGAPGFDPTRGLPVDPNRTIVVNGTHLGPDDEIGFMQRKAAGVAVRGGYAEIGDSVHHARIYRIDGKRPTYSMVRVFTSDLLRYRTQDLFTVDLPPQAISIRSAEPKMREALAHGSAAYIGWLVVGDEMLLTMDEFADGDTAVAKFLEVYPETKRWVLDGFYSASQLRLRPRYFAAEGLTDDAHYQVRKVVEIPGWRPAVNALFARAAPRIIRRDTLGRPRLTSAAHLPLSWQVTEV